MLGACARAGLSLRPALAAGAARGWRASPPELAGSLAALGAGTEAALWRRQASTVSARPAAGEAGRSLEGPDAGRARGGRLPARVVAYGSDVVGNLGDDSGTLFRTAPREVFLGVDVSAVDVDSAGGNNIACSAEGHVYTWGSCRTMRRTTQMWSFLRDSPRLISFLRGLPLHGLSFGPKQPYPLRVAPFGDLDEALDAYPRARLPFLLNRDSVHITKVACAASALAAVSRNGHLYTWSPAGSMPMLGHGTHLDEVLLSKHPRAVQGLTGVVDVVFGLTVSRWPIESRREGRCLCGWENACEGGRSLHCLSLSPSLSLSHSSSPPLPCSTCWC